jgi:hypothetical protein
MHVMLARRLLLVPLQNGRMNSDPAVIVISRETPQV